MVITVVYYVDNLSNCPSGHQIFHRALKLNSKNSKKKKKKNLTHRSQLISQWEARENFPDFYRDHFLYQLCLKNTEIP